ncbi:zinc finger BED domain-containing protein DAYSLEEPER-like [Brassica napus]|nr:zinc finger BED domain-containing protein DAYSLEEPER-like [Brassica napus]
MLVRALKFRKAFDNLHLYDRNYKCLPSEEEWDRGEKIRDFLKPFSTITAYFSGVNYPTASVYFMLVWKIELLLKRYARCKDNEIRLMVVDMKSKFAKYWDEYSLILAMAAVLDPRIKLHMLKEAYHKLDPRTSEKKVEVVRKSLELLYKEYSSKSSESSSRFAKKTPHELLTESPLEDDFDDDLLELERCIQFGSNNERTNLDMYLADTKVDISAFSDMEVLDYWKDKQHRYGDLALLARDILSIPITTVAFEFAFSVGGRVLSPLETVSTLKLSKH